jgi:hypothetical protein
MLAMSMASCRVFPELYKDLKFEKDKTSQEE